jgi:hypothetical protein
MTKHTINLDGSHTVTKGPRDKAWVASVTADLGALSTEMVVALAVHGLQQKIADAASGAQTADEANASMQKALDAILAGEWTRRGGASDGVDEFTATARRLVRAAIKAKVGGKSPEWAAFTGLSDDEQNAKLDANFAANRAALEPAVNAEIERKRAERAAKAETVKSVSFEL